MSRLLSFFGLSATLFGTAAAQVLTVNGVSYVELTNDEIFGFDYQSLRKN